jgi:hypothetical protein
VEAPEPAKTLERLGIAARTSSRHDGCPLRHPGDVMVFDRQVYVSAALLVVFEVAVLIIHVVSR